MCPSLQNSITKPGKYCLFVVVLRSILSPGAADGPGLARCQDSNLADHPRLPLVVALRPESLPQASSQSLFHRQPFFPSPVASSNFFPFSPILHPAPSSANSQRPAT